MSQDRQQYVPCHKKWSVQFLSSTERHEPKHPIKVFYKSPASQRDSSSPRSFKKKKKKSFSEKLTHSQSTGYESDKGILHVAISMIFFSFFKGNVPVNTMNSKSNTITYNVFSLYKTWRDSLWSCFPSVNLHCCENNNWKHSSYVFWVYIHVESYWPYEHLESLGNLHVKCFDKHNSHHPKNCKFILFITPKRPPLYQLKGSRLAQFDPIIQVLTIASQAIQTPLDQQ